MQPTIAHVLVAVDFTPASTAASEYGFMLARRLGAHVHLVHVLDESSGDGRSYPEQCRVALDRLSRDATAIDAEAGVSVDVRSGPVTRTIARAAIDCGADLLVLGTHDGGGLRQMVTGDRAARLRRLAQCPVLTVGAGDPAHRKAVWGARDPRSPGATSAAAA